MGLFKPEKRLDEFALEVDVGVVVEFPKNEGTVLSFEVVEGGGGPKVNPPLAGFGASSFFS